MATKLDILILPTYNSLTLGVADNSTYVGTPVSPTIEITVPGFGMVSQPFIINDFNIFTSSNLEISSIDVNEPLPDGVYYIKYSIDPALTNYVEKSIIRIEQIQEKFDKVFMSLDMMECDRAIKEQTYVTLNTIYFHIQGAVAAANNCAVLEAEKLYIQADKMLNNFSNNCGCSGINYITKFN